MSQQTVIASLVRPSVRKRGEFTYGIRKEDLLKFAPDNAVTLIPKSQMSEILTEMDLYLVGSRRSLNDAVEFLRQFIPYTLLWRVTDDLSGIEFAVYMRNKQNGETRLATQLSLGAGGHVESLDAQTYDDEEGNLTSEVSVDLTLRNAREREEYEEVEHLDPVMVDPIPLGFVMDSKPTPGYVGNTHVGLIVATEMSEGGDFDMKEHLNDRIGWKTPEQLMMERDGSEGLPAYEPWSQLIIDVMPELAHRLMTERAARLERVLIQTAIDDEAVEELVEHHNQLVG